MQRWLKFFGFLLGGLAIITVSAFVIASQLVSSDDPIAGTTAQTFPSMEGTSLLLEKVNVPTELEGELKLIVVAYDSDQQTFVNKWLLPLEELNTEYPQLRGYYVPLLPQDTSDAALAIIGGMTLAASGDRDRARTIVTFTDVEQFNALVDVQGVDDIQLFLLDADNTIQWRGQGRYDPVILASLEDALMQPD